MSITVKRVPIERRNSGTITFEVKGKDIGKTYDFMGMLAGFRVTDVNLTVDEAFDNTDNKISVGIEGDLVRFIPQTAVNAVKGVAFNNRQLTASQTMSVVIDVVGAVSVNGSATVTVAYVKLPDSRQEY